MQEYVTPTGQAAWMLDTQAVAFDAGQYLVTPVEKAQANELVVRHHYLHRGDDPFHSG